MLLPSVHPIQPINAATSKAVIAPNTSFAGIQSTTISLSQPTQAVPFEVVATTSQLVSAALINSTQPSPTHLFATSEPVDIVVPPNSAPNQIVIHFNPAASEQERNAYIQQLGGTVNQSIIALDVVVVNVSANVAAQALPLSSIVVVSEPDYYISALDVPTNDPLYSQQWALPVIGASEAWAVLPTDAPFITVAVIDSGICADHPDLIGRIGDGWDFLENDAIPQDDFGHGCSVSGIIAANTNDGIGIAGVAPNTRIMPLRVLNAQGIGTYSDVAAALIYATDHGAQIINLSLRGGNPSNLLADAVNYAVSQGIMVIAAAGNTGGSVLYPAAYDLVIAVAAVDSDLQRSSFSSFGPQVDLLAPGRDILTTRINGGYGFLSTGTSFAAPYVAGVASLEMAFGRTLTLGGG